jgi:hypothetical protein
MRKCCWSLVVVLGLMLAGTAIAQKYPMLDRVANRVVQKYRSATCDELWALRAAKRDMPRPPEEQRLIDLLRSDPGMRNEFFRRVSAPIVTKMFECGMIP